MKLLITEPLSKKIKWWLSKTDKEWSGVAYYKINKYNERNFPLEVELVYFNVLDIGSHTTTEWSAQLLAKAQNKFLRSDNVDVDKCFQGLIHSHNTMSCHFSDTDDDTMKEHAPNENFYFSLIVSTNYLSHRGFKLSYIDQYGIVSIVGIKAEDIIEDFELVSQKDWVDEYTIIKKRKAKEIILEKASKKGENNYGKKFQWGYSKDSFGIYGVQENNLIYESDDEFDIYNIDIKDTEIDLQMDFFDKEYSDKIQKEIIVIREALFFGQLDYEKVFEYCKMNRIQPKEITGGI